ncbi:MAG: cytochrome c-type biogenesis protein CcmH [Acidimicrobiales bacterium]
MTWPKSPAFRRASWIVIGAVVLVSLGRAAFDDGPPRSTEEQVEAIARTLKCPVCESQSVADSDVAASRAIRAEIARLVEEGESPNDVRAAIGASFGEQVQLIPPASGFAGLVWILPVVVLIVALAGVSAALARWRRRARSTPSDDDRALVEEALRER